MPDPTLPTLDDPAFAAYIAQRAQELQAAQMAAADARRGADLGAGFERGGAMIAGRPVDQGAIQADYDRANRPLTDLMMRRGAEEQAGKDYLTRLAIGEHAQKSAAMRASIDPNSDLSKRARMLAVAQGLIPASYEGDYTASMHEDMLKGANIQQAREAHQAQIAQAQALLGETQAHHRATEAHQQEMEKLRQQELGIKAGKEKEVPPRQLERMAAIKNTLSSLDELENLFNATGDQSVGTTGPIVGGLKSINPWQGAPVARVEALSKMMLESLPRSLKNGVPTQTEIKNAEKYVPTIRDTPEQRKAKIAVARQKVQSSLDELKQTYGEGGLNVRRLTTGGGSDAALGTSSAPADAGPIITGKSGKHYRIVDGQYVEVPGTTEAP